MNGVRWSGDAQVVVGTPAIFASENLRVAIIDEEHEAAYVRTAPLPCQREAILRAQYNRCSLVLQSATPS